MRWVTEFEVFWNFRLSLTCSGNCSTSAARSLRHAQHRSHLSPEGEVGGGGVSWWVSRLMNGASGVMAHDPRLCWSATSQGKLNQYYFVSIFLTELTLANPRHCWEHWAERKRKRGKRSWPSYITSSLSVAIMLSATHMGKPVVAQGVQVYHVYLCFDSVGSDSD